MCLTCHQRLWRESSDTQKLHACPICRGELLEPNSFGNYDLMAVYPTAELLAGSDDTQNTTTIEANCVSRATVVASKIMNLPKCLSYYVEEALRMDQRMPGWTDKFECA